MIRTKPVVTEAMQFRGPSFDTDAMVAFDDWIVANQGDRKCRYVGNKLIIPSPDGDHRVNPGDWIIRGAAGELFPCRADIFEEIYEAA